MNIFALVCLAVLNSSGPASARYVDAPQGPSGFALSPDEKTILVGGPNRTLYVIDAKSLNVIRRVWFKRVITHIEYNKDGSHVVLERSSDNCIADAGTFEIKKTFITGLGAFAAYARSADLMVAPEIGGRYLSVLSMTDGTEKGKIETKAKLEQGQLALDSEGKTLVFWTGSERNSEKSVPPNERPKGLKGLEQLKYDMQHDEYGSTLYF